MLTETQVDRIQAQGSNQTAKAEGERNKELFLRFIDEGFNKGNLAVVDEIVAPDFQERQFFGPHHPGGPEGVKKTIIDLRTIFPDFRLTLQDLVVDGDKVWALFLGGGTNGGEFLGRPPTGKQAAVQVIDICRFENGKMVEHWGVPDRFHLMFQLGVLPKPPQPTV